MVWRAWTAEDGDENSPWRETESGLLIPRELVEPTPRVCGVDLFCGAGGFSLGLQMAGIDMIGAVEWDPEAVMTYLDNLSHPDVELACVTEEDKERFERTEKKNARAGGTFSMEALRARQVTEGCRGMVVGDIREIAGWMIVDTMRAGGWTGTKVDVVCGGPPCQGFSHAGKRKPEDPRNNLILEFLRVGGELDAETILMENVPPLLQSKKFRPLIDRWVEEAHALGYGVTGTILDAANYGVPQHRRRAFIAATRGERPFEFPMPTHWANVWPLDGEAYVEPGTSDTEESP